MVESMRPYNHIIRGRCIFNQVPYHDLYGVVLDSKLSPQGDIPLQLHLFSKNPTNDPWKALSLFSSRRILLKVS